MRGADMGHLPLQANGSAYKANICRKTVQTSKYNFFFCFMFSLFIYLCLSVPQSFCLAVSVVLSLCISCLSPTLFVFISIKLTAAEKLSEQLNSTKKFETFD